MILEDFEDFRHRMHNQWPFSLAGNAVQQQGQAQDVIKMAVGNENMVDACQSSTRQPRNAAAGIQQDVIVDQE